MEAIILVIIVLVLLGFCMTPVIKETITKNALKGDDTFIAIEEAMSYDEVKEIMGDVDAVSIKEQRVGIHRKQLKCIWNFSEENGKKYQLVAVFEKDMLISKDIICNIW